VKILVLIYRVLYYYIAYTYSLCNASRSIELKPLMYQDDRRRQANPAAARTTSEPPLNGIDAEHACSQLVFDTTIDPPRATSVRERVRTGYRSSGWCSGAFVSELDAPLHILSHLVVWAECKSLRLAKSPPVATTSVSDVGLRTHTGACGGDDLEKGTQSKVRHYHLIIV
jgi:hypothetical protein